MEKQLLVLLQLRFFLFVSPVVGITPLCLYGHPRYLPPYGLVLFLYRV